MKLKNNIETILKKAFKGCSEERIMWTVVFIVAYIFLSLLGVPFLCGYPINYGDVFHMYLFIFPILAQVLMVVAIIVLLTSKIVKWAIKKFYDGVS